MKRYILKRLVISLIVLIGISLLVFALIQLQPGNPYSLMISPSTKPEAYQRMLEKVGYYDPFPVKYLNWFWRFLSGDMGYSIVSNKPVLAMIMDRASNTLLLTGTAFCFSLSLGTVLGFSTALHQGSFGDNLVTFITLICLSIPPFFIGLLLIKCFAYDLAWLPASGLEDVRANSTGLLHLKDVASHLLLPALTLAISQVTFYQRFIRSTFVKLLDADYLITAMAKGLTFKEAVIKHGAKNVLIPILTLVFLQLPSLFSGALITETVFVWPGIGKLTYDAVMRRDYMVIMSVLMISSILVLACNLIADLLYASIDKRIEWR